MPATIGHVYRTGAGYVLTPVRIETDRVTFKTLGCPCFAGLPARTCAGHAEMPRCFEPATVADHLQTGWFVDMDDADEPAIPGLESVRTAETPDRPFALPRADPHDFTLTAVAALPAQGGLDFD